MVTTTKSPSGLRKTIGCTTNVVQACESGETARKHKQARHTKEPAGPPRPIDEASEGRRRTARGRWRGQARPASDLPLRGRSRSPSKEREQEHAHGAKATARAQGTTRRRRERARQGGKRRLTTELAQAAAPSTSERQADRAEAGHFLRQLWYCSSTVATRSCAMRTALPKLSLLSA